MTDIILTESTKPCPNCAYEDRIFTLKLISYNQGYIKYIPQIKESCGSCKRYIRFAPQTSELMDKFNRLLEEIKLP